MTLLLGSHHLGNELGELVAPEVVGDVGTVHVDLPAVGVDVQLV
jgi:hypothetical protein